VTKNDPPAKAARQTSNEFDWSWTPDQINRKLDLGVLERRALRASHGPWRAGVVESENAVWACDGSALGGQRLLLRMSEHYEHTDDRIYIASVAPEVVLELIARIRAAQHPLVVRTARVSHKSDDVLDVTRKSGKDGLFLAPSWELLGPMLRVRKAMNDARIAKIKSPSDSAQRLLADTTLAFSEAWDAYIQGYLQEMRASYRQRAADWKKLLERESVTLVCYCTDPFHCHRTLLATRVLPALGALYAGEVDSK
jgi:uncharacterized protein YeaO (DUF488 family)